MLEKWTRREDNNETKRENWMKWTDTWGMAARIKPTESSEKAKKSRWIEFAHVWFSTKIWIFDSQWWLAGQREIGYHRAFGNAIVKDLENIYKAQRAKSGGQKSWGRFRKASHLYNNKRNTTKFQISVSVFLHFFLLLLLGYCCVLARNSHSENRDLISETVHSGVFLWKGAHFKADFSVQESTLFSYLSPAAWFFSASPLFPHVPPRLPTFSLLLSIFGSHIEFSISIYIRLCLGGCTRAFGDSCLPLVAFVSLSR